MDDSQLTEPYTVEQLQDRYSLSISRAVDSLDRCGGDRVLIDKIMKRYNGHQGEVDRKPSRTAAVGSGT